MTRKQNVMTKASGALGTALAARIVRDFGNVQAFAKRIGYSPWSVWRWVQNDIAPSAEGAECLTTIYPELQPLLEAKGCYKGRVRPPLGKRAETASRSQARIADALRGASSFAAAHLLPWPSEPVKVARRPVVAALVEQRAQAAKTRRKATTRAVRKTMPRRPRRVSHSGDFIERMDEIAAADARFTPSYAMEDR